MFKLMKQRKAIILHPVTWIVISFVIGLIVMYLLIRQGIVPMK